MRKRVKAIVRHGIAAAAVLGLVVTQAGMTGADSGDSNALPTATPIKHLVIIFGENISFDHYFGTYPKAANPPANHHSKPRRGRPTLTD